MGCFMGEQTAKVTNFPHFPFEHHFLDGFGIPFFLPKETCRCTCMLVQFLSSWWTLLVRSWRFCPGGDGVWGVRGLETSSPPKKPGVSCWGVMFILRWYFGHIYLHLSWFSSPKKWLLQFLKKKNVDFCTPKIYCYLYSPFRRGGKGSVSQNDDFCVRDFSVGHQTIHC